MKEQVPTISSQQDNTETNKPMNPLELLGQGIGLYRLANNLGNINSDTVKQAATQELTNVLRSPTDPSSKNVSIINRLFGKN